MAALLLETRSLRTLLVVTLVIVLFAIAAVFAGPLASGALFLLVPDARAAASWDLPADYQPLHKGGIDLPTGLYIRENEDLVVPGAPALILRRTYLSGYRVSKQFGIGTTHNGEEYLIGDGERFQWAALITAKGSRINFRRVSSGTSLLNAMYVRDEGPLEWQGTRLGWTGINWLLKKADGSVGIFRACGPGGDLCSILQWRYGDGRAVRFPRDKAGALLRMQDEDGGRWIAFDYDDKGRIIRARASTQRETRYDYDARGRLIRVSGSDGVVRLYTYTELDELASIEEPGTLIENEYRDGRCVRQINRYPDSEPLVFDFAYEIAAGKVTKTTTRQSDGIWTEQTWSDGGYALSEKWGREGFEPAVFTYERDPVTKIVTGLTVTCPDRRGRPLQHSAVIRPGEEERVKWDLLRTHCH
jgi:YD repeat-containing protein